MRPFRHELLNNGYLELPVTAEHALAVTMLPPLHKDPFDRILVAQSIAEGITLLTSDRISSAISRADPAGIGYSITSSAWVSNSGGMSRSSVFAVLRLTASASLVACSTGKSPAFSPRNTLST